MGEEKKYDGVVCICFDGKLIPLIGLHDLPDVTEDPAMEEARRKTMDYAGAGDDDVAEIHGYTMTLWLSRQKLYKTLLGWHGRGPIRMRALLNACKMIVDSAAV